MADYIEWSNVRPHLDEVVVDAPDQDTLAEAISYAESKFNNALRQRFDVPFVEADEPNAYALAQQICAMWAAAYYLINGRQSEKNEEIATWYPDRLNVMADGIFEVFSEGEPPTDTPDSGFDFDELPDDGYDDLTVAAKANLKPFFKRSHLRTGKSTHW